MRPKPSTVKHLSKVLSRTLSHPRKHSSTSRPSWRPQLRLSMRKFAPTKCWTISARPVCSPSSRTGNPRRCDSGSRTRSLLETSRLTWDGGAEEKEEKSDMRGRTQADSIGVQTFGVQHPTSVFLWPRLWTHKKIPKCKCIALVQAPILRLACQGVNNQLISQCQHFPPVYTSALGIQCHIHAILDGGDAQKLSSLRMPLCELGLTAHTRLPMVRLSLSGR